MLNSNDLALWMAERQQQKMLAKISELEGVNIGEKRWETAGEIGSKQRPLNSLVESSLDYQHAGKVKPVRLSLTPAAGALGGICDDYSLSEWCACGGNTVPVDVLL